jgi:serine/threonine-protein kinase
LDDGSIIFQPNALNAPLFRVSSAGGTPQPVGKLADGEKTQRWPDGLPGGKSILYTSHDAQADFDRANIVTLDLTTGARKVIQRAAYFGRYVASGHLLFVHEGTIFAVPFDPARLETTGPSVPVLEGVASGPGGVGRNGAAQIAISETGSAAYLQGESFTGVPLDLMTARER